MYQRDSVSRQQSGFTLLEVILALAIFAALSITANQVLKNVLFSNEQSQQVGEQLKQLQRARVILDSDFRQILARRYRNSGEESGELLIEMSDGLNDSEEQGVRFVRGGWINPQSLFPRGEVVKVGYRLKDNKLERVRWMYPDDSPSTEPAVMMVMDGVSKLSFEVFNEGEWTPIWDTPEVMPQALRLKLTLDRYGDIERVYQLPAQSLAFENNEQEQVR
ncbi:type II secretion system protein GspJ [Veronia nyctiphanis]|uniref:Type II secretion system protein J n=1 Tax=Veronia nyctiphanis TaxID=1278244 RepID=A0A4Q0YPZ6_9GAMM|nr:type II secretion system minor pseudopilin GspJ [Veronia nyctiphanis]RXJ72663.1 type II secretion system protein GspJ [Veronia nyctiphanis]